MMSLIECHTDTGTVGRPMCGRLSCKVKRSLVAILYSAGASVSCSPMCIA